MDKYFVVCFTFSLLLLSLPVSIGQECTEGFMDYELLSVKASQIGNSTIDDTVNGIGSSSYVMPSLSFTCSGTITGFLLALDIRIDNNRNLHPWIGLFNKFNPTMYTLVSSSTRDIILGPDDFSTSGLYNYTLSSPIQFTSGDIIGVYQPDIDDSVVILQIQQYGTEHIIETNKQKGQQEQYKVTGASIDDARLLVRPLITTTDGTTIDNCLNRFISLEDIQVNARLVTNVSEAYTSTTHEDVFFNDIKFTCDGSITHVIAGLNNNTGQTSNPPVIRIWRPDVDGTYTQSGPTIPLYYSNAVSDISTDYLRVYNLSVPVPVKEGDVLGIYQTDESDAVLYYQQYNGPYNYDGSNGQSTGFNFYPLVSVVVDDTIGMSLGTSTSLITTTVTATSITASATILSSPTLSDTTVYTDTEMSLGLEMSTATASATTDSSSSLFSSSNSATEVTTEMMSTNVPDSNVQGSTEMFPGTSTLNTANTTTLLRSSSPTNEGYNTTSSTSNRDHTTETTLVSLTSRLNRPDLTKSPPVSVLSTSRIIQSVSTKLPPASGASTEGNSSVAGIVAGILVGVIVINVLVIAAVVLIMRRRSKKFETTNGRKPSLIRYVDDGMPPDTNGGMMNAVYQGIEPNEKQQPTTNDINNFNNPTYQDTDVATVSQPLYEPLTSATTSAKQYNQHPTVERTPSNYEVPSQGTLPPTLPPYPNGHQHRLSTSLHPTVKHTPSNYEVPADGTLSNPPPQDSAVYSDANPPPVPPPNPAFHTIANATYEACDETDQEDKPQQNSQFPNAIYELWDEADPKDDKTQLYSSIQAGLCVPTMVQREQLGINKEFQEGDIYGILESQYSSISDCAEGFFKEEDIYWDPENNTKGVYEQLAQRRYREIPRNEIRTVSHLGSGQFGTVDKGIWDTPKGAVEVAVKTVSGSITEEDEVKFLQEAAINGQFHHPNVVQLCGVVTVGQPIMIVLEYVSHGDLRSFLRSIRPAPGELPDASLAPLLFKFSHQVAHGMAYLSGKKFIHRDLAARNILVDNGTVCKIADFGMSRNLQDEAYYTSNNKKVPIKWTAPEAINYRKYSTQSDVWSFGALLYELWSAGHKPFEGSTNQECIGMIGTGYRLPSPSGCPRAVYQIMINCWNPVPSDRPSFDSLQSLLSNNESLSSSDDHPLSNLGLSIHDQSLYPELQNKYKK